MDEKGVGDARISERRRVSEISYFTKDQVDGTLLWSLQDMSQRSQLVNLFFISIFKI